MTYLTPVAQFVARYPSVDGYDLIYFLERYSRLVGASVAELLSEGLESEATARFYVGAIRRLAGQDSRVKNSA
jgi:hypothetical protein